MPTEAQKKATRKWKQNNMTVIAVHMRNEAKEQFRSVCEQNGTTMNAVLLAAMRSYLAQHSDGKEQTSIDLPSGWAEAKPSVIRTFHASGGWQLDIDENSTHYGAWLSNIGSDQKQYFVGADKSKHTLDEFCSLVLDNIAEYQHDYANEFLGE